VARTPIIKLILATAKAAVNSTGLYRLKVAWDKRAIEKEIAKAQNKALIIRIVGSTMFNDKLNTREIAKTTNNKI
jgi:hypothetical protein